MWTWETKKNSTSNRVEITPVVRAERSFLLRLFGVLWRWRTELAIVLVGSVAWAWLAIQLNPIWALVIQIICVSILFAVPVSRRFIMRRSWCVITRHRIRSCMVQLKIENRSTRLPFIVWVRPTPVGEKAKICLRAGQSPDALINAADSFAATCWAREARIENDRAHTNIVMVHIVRHDPLSQPQPIASPLMAVSSKFGSVDVNDMIPSFESLTPKAIAVKDEEKPRKTSRKTNHHPQQSQISMART